MEDADLAAAQDLFGSNVNLDTLQPKSAKEFEDFGAALVQKYVLPHEKSAHYKALVKAVSPSVCPRVCLRSWRGYWLETHALLRWAGKFNKGR